MPRPYPRSCAAALLALSLAAAVPVAAAAPVYREFGSWVVACDNTARCEASGAREDATAALYLTREAGPAGALSLVLESDAPLSARSLRLDGHALPLEPAHWQSQEGEVYAHALRSRDAATVRAFVARIRNGDTLQLGDAAGTVALQGLSAALLLLDETQGRLGNATALLRVGPAPASRVPAAPAPPAAPRAVVARHALDAATGQRLIAAVRRSQAALLRREECSATGGSDSFDSADALDDRQALVMIECLRGAYQSSSLLFQVPLDAPGRARRVVLELPFALEGKPYRIDMPTSPDFTGGELGYSAKGRGLADCGESGGWVWDGQAFRLTEFRYLSACRGGSGGNWPVLWRTAGTH